MTNPKELIEWLKTTWNYESFTTKTFLLLVLSLFLLFYISSKIRKICVSKVFPRYDLDIGVSQSIATIVRYSARATTIITNDNIAVIVPNSDFINSR